MSKNPQPWVNDEDEFDRQLQDSQTLNLQQDVNRWKVAHVVVDEIFDTVQVGLYDTRTNSAICFTVSPSDLGVERESKDGFPIRYIAQVVVIGRDRTKREVFADIINPDNEISY